VAPDVTTPERWARIERLYHEALACGATERESFLASACVGDEALRREVESLLAHDGAAAFLSTPAVANGIGERIRIGQALGPYVISTQIGEGGMGEVYRARDTKLHRDVALKILPAAFALDPDRLARFTREAHVLASLNHPHIAAIYGLEESSGVRALVLELVDGPTLADRLARPIPREEALLIAKQIAEALEAAHEQGILHRDLKPANIALTRDGQVKVLDFGLAKALEPASGTQSDITASPALTTPVMTGMGVVLGTAAYMSPEQATGRPVDKRSDIWAFGCVLYEMLVGTRAFEGEAVSGTLACVITKEPDWTALPADTPAPIRKLLGRCLEKDRRRRLTDITDARFEIEEALAPSSREPVAASRATLTIRGLPWTIAAAAVAVAGTIFVLSVPSRKVPPPAPLRLSAELGADASLVTDQGTAAILSPNGVVLAFVAQKSPGGRSQLYIRRLEQLQATALSGTEEARNPFFSPDGQWIAFFAGGTLKKISVTGGSAVTLCDAYNGLGGGAWANDDTVIFSDSADRTGLWRVSSRGGKPELLTTAVEGEIYRWPQVLPGGRAVLYTSQAGRFASPNIVVQTLPNGPRKILLRSGYLYGRYLPSGHLLYMKDRTLFAVPFDLDRLALVGPPVPALEGVAVDAATGAQFAAAANGTLVYLPAQVASDEAPISWMDRAGKTTPLRTTPANWSNPADPERPDDPADAGGRSLGVEAREAYRVREQPLHRNLPNVLAGRPLAGVRF
jgi:serine/threonine-protein kinase